MSERIGTKDPQTVVAGGRRAAPAAIDGVVIHEIGNVMTRSGHMAEVFRTDWPAVTIDVRQVNWVHLNPGAVTDWHTHARQTDYLIAVNGSVKLALWDGREKSPTRGAVEIVRMGVARPVMVVVPPGVWHGLRNEGGTAAGYINVTNQHYVHHDPDNWRATPGAGQIPDIL